MSSSVTNNELREQLASRVLARLQPAGWRAQRGWRSEHLVEFTRSLDEDFLAVVAVFCAVGSDRPPLLIDHIYVGLRYEPLARLYPLLAERFCQFLPQGELDDDLPREAEDGCLFEVRDRGDVEGVAARLSEIILARAVSAVEGHATLDALLEQLVEEQEEEEDPWEGGPVTAAILAAAGRLEEADAVLAKASQSGTGRDAGRLVRQLRRWIDSGGDPSLIPSEPPPCRYAPRERKPFVEMWTESRARTRAREAARDEVRRRGAGRTRAEQRAMLEEALARHGQSAPPLWCETTLDHLWDSRADRTKATADALKEVGRLGLGLVRAIRNRELPDLTPPEWIQPPAHACYELPPGEHQVQVQLDPNAFDWLDRVYDACPRFFGTAVDVPVWLDHEPGPGSRLAVHIGSRRVGCLREDTSTAFRPAMAAARFRDELPCASAHLTLRPDPSRYLLEVASPAPIPAANA